MDTNHLYPIRTVAELTGVNPVTLRAWERRYGLVVPKRTEKGHRLYSEEDIENIRQILALLDRGIAISSVQNMMKSRADATVPATESVSDTSTWETYSSGMMEAIVHFDEDGLEQIYNDALSLYPIDMVTNRLLLPLLVLLGERWEKSEGSAAEEHFFSTYLRNKLGARFHHRNRSKGGPRLLCACLPGEHHEIGLLLFAITAHEHGYRPTLLGADVPVADLPHACHNSGCDALVLSVSIEPDKRLLAEDLPRLVDQAGVPVFLGGIISETSRDLVNAAGAIAVDDNIRQGIQQIGAIVKRGK